MSQTQWTVREVLSWTQDRFAREGLESARLDAEVLLAHALGSDRVGLYIDLERPLSQAERERYRALVSERLQRLPVAYLVGEREFFSRAFEVNPWVMVPRPETETLVEQALIQLRPRVRPRILDVGTGSGAIAVTLAAERPDATVWATDLSAEALAVAERNALRHEVKLTFQQGDLLEALPADCAPFDLIAANLPYIPETERDQLAPELHQEPATALFTAEDGLVLIRKLVSQAPAHLVPGGWLLLEVGLGQADAVRGMATDAGLDGALEVHCDLASIPRVVAAARPE